ARRTMNNLLSTASAVTLAALATFAFSGTAGANQKLVELSKSNENWVMPGKNYSSTNFSEMTQINKDNVKDLAPAWSFSTGVLNGHEGTPLVVDGMMYIHSPYPNATYAIGLDDPSKIVWQNKPKQDPAARAVACCDVVNRGLAYWPGDEQRGPLVFRTQLDGNIVALDAKTGETVWAMENADIRVGATL